MYIRISGDMDVFGRHTYINTEYAFGVVEGPSAERMRQLQGAEELYNPNVDSICFETPGRIWEVLELETVTEHPRLIDTWLVQAIVSDPDYTEMEIKAIWSPENRRHCYLARYIDLVRK